MNSNSRIDLTEEQKTQVEALAAYLTADQIADYLGINRRTFFKILERDEETHALYKKGKAKAIGSIAKSLMMKAHNGDTTAAIFFLKTQARWKENHDTEQTQKSPAVRFTVAVKDD